MKKLPALISASCLLTLALPAQAQLGLTLPAASGKSLQLAGDNTTANGGIAAESLTAHAIISLNAPPIGAYRYLMGAESSGASHAPAYSNTAATTGFTGMAGTTAYIAGNSLDAANLTLRFGPTGAASGTWNLGADALGVNYYANSISTIEERIYSATPSAVEAALYYSGVKLLTFDYSDLYMIIDYRTAASDDDTIQAYSEAVGFTQAGGLSGANLGLSEALIADFNAGGGLAQLRFDSFQTANRIDAAGSLGVTGLFSFSGSIQAVPEPSTYASCLGSIMLITTLFARRRSNKA